MPDLLTRVGVEILQAGAGVVEDDAVVRLQEVTRDELASRDDAGRALGSREDSFKRGKLPSGIENFFVADGDGGSRTFAEDIQNQHIAERLGDAQAGGDGRGVLPELGARCA